MLLLRRYRLELGRLLTRLDVHADACAVLEVDLLLDVLAVRVQVLVTFLSARAFECNQNKNTIRRTS